MTSIGTSPQVSGSPVRLSVTLRWHSSRGTLQVSCRTNVRIEGTGGRQMITYSTSDLFLSPGQALVNTVNTVGVMGKGIAKDFKAIYPEMFTEYQTACEAGEFGIGDLLYYRSRNKTVVNLPTKRHWRGPSRLEYVEEGLRAFVASYRSEGVTSVAFPQLGCGNGELDWESQVRPLMVRYLGPLSIPVYIHIYSDTNPVEHRDVRAMKHWLRQEPRSLGFVEFWDDVTAVFERHEFERTVTTDEAGDRREIVKVVQGTRIRVTDQTDWLDVWSQLRTAGYLTIGELGQAFHEVEGSVLDLLTELPYVAWVSVADGSIQPEGVTVAGLLERTSSRGIQLLPDVISMRVGATTPTVDMQTLQAALPLGR